MKKTLLSAVAALLITAGISQQIEYDGSILNKVWQSEGFKVPESVLYDEGRNLIYVSNINGKPTEMDNNGFISKLDVQGEIIDMKWIEGELSAPKGMGIYKNKLYVTDIDALVEIDIDKGEVMERYAVEGAKFMNDIAIDDKGVVYATDMSTHKIHKLENGKISLWLEDEILKSPNGLWLDNDKLIVGCKDLLSVDTENKSIRILVDHLNDGVDGIVMDSRDNIIFSHWKGNVFLYEKGGEVREILNTAEDEIQSADIGIIKNRHLLLVPTFYDNRVVAYEIDMQEEEE